VPSFTPYGLVSLGEIMRRISLHDCVILGQRITQVLRALGSPQVDESKAFDDDAELFAVLADMLKTCKTIGARKTGRLLQARLDGDSDDAWDRAKPREVRELSVLVDAFEKELEDRLFLYMPLPDAEFYQSNKLLSAKARTAFPKLSQELRSAGNAYACGLPTASVFHCMRALEHALSALATDVGLKWEKEQWHTIIELIESRIESERKTLPRGLPKDERLQFLSEAAKEFFYFKDGWRNYVAHNRISYEGPQALEVLEHVQAFTEKLAMRLNE
jgi:hypothetical protein